MGDRKIFNGSPVFVNFLKSALWSGLVSRQLYEEIKHFLIKYTKTGQNLKMFSSFGYLGFIFWVVAHHKTGRSLG